MTENINPPSSQPNQNPASGVKPVPADMVMAQQHIEHRVEFSGPLPHPAILEQYEKILPGSAERILSMAEKQSNHRQTMEKRIIYSETFQAKVGMFFAFTIVIIALFIGGYLSLKGLPVSGLISLTTAIGVIVTTFGLKRSSEKKVSQVSPLPSKPK